MPEPVEALLRRSVDRIHEVYDAHDFVYASSSGGKDSMVLVECAAVAGRERGIRPLVRFYDEELVSRHTLEYMERLRLRDDLEVEWYALEVRENDAWSHDTPYWYPWDPRARARWGREPPPYALREIAGYRPEERRYSLVGVERSFARALLPRTVCRMLGRRSAESPARSTRHAYSGWLNSTLGPGFTADPVYDWSNRDVWRGAQHFGWDWNRAYLAQYRAGVGHPTALRIGPLLGEEPSSTLFAVAKWDPDLWSRVVRRVPDALTLARYARTAVLGRGKGVGGGLDRRALRAALARLDPAKRRLARTAILDLVRSDLGRIRRPLDYGGIARVAVRGDSKGYRLKLSLLTRAMVDESKRGNFRRYSLRGRVESIRAAAKAVRKARKREARP